GLRRVLPRPAVLGAHDSHRRTTHPGRLQHHEPGQARERARHGPLTCHSSASPLVFRSSELFVERERSIKMATRIDALRVSPRAFQAMMGLQNYVNTTLEPSLLELV